MAYNHVMGKSFVFIGMMMATFWLILVVLVGTSVVFPAIGISTTTHEHLYDVAIPWFRWLSYSVMLCLVGLSIHVVFEESRDKK